MSQGLRRTVVLLVVLGAALGVLLVAEAAPRPAVAKPAAKAEMPKNDDCLACHADRDLKRSAARPGKGAAVFVDATALHASTHASLDCVSCHTTATAPHGDTLPRVDCAGCHDAAAAKLATGVHGSRAPGHAGPACAACHGTHDVRPASAANIDTCARCHPTQVTQYRESAHGKAQRTSGSEAATCASCHGATHTVIGRKDPQSPTYHLNLPRTCAACHANPELAKRHNMRVTNAYQLYMDSIHGRALSRSGLLVAANCSDCHGAHDIKPAAEPTSRVNRVNVPATCGGCHAGVLRAYAESVHGKAVAGGNTVAPVCTGCHTAHEIRRVTGAPWQLDVIKECGTCHEESLKTYRDTFHGKVTSLGGTRVAKCADCHGSHSILPAADPRSTVANTNIVGTCRQCHADANFAFTRFHPHADPHDRARFPLLYYPYVIMTALLIGTFGFFGLHTVLWLPRSLVERLRRRRHGEEEE